MAGRQTKSKFDQQRSKSSMRQGAEDRSSVDVRFLALVVIWGGALLIYLAWFYRGEYAEGLARYTPLSLLLVPDQLLADWFGSPTGHVAVADRVPLVITAVAIWGAAFLAGRLALLAVGIRSLLTPLERVVFSLAVGLSLISLVTLVIGLLGQLQSAWWYATVGLALVAATVWSTRRRSNVSETSASAKNLTDPGPTRALLLGLPFVGILFLGALLPPVDFDVLEYHLQVPKEWFQQGSIRFLPHNIYGNMPLGAELLSVPAMALLPGDQSWWWGALVGKLLIAGFAPLAGLAVFAAGTRFVNATAGVVGALVYISTPWVAVVSMNGLIDGVLACYLFLSLYAFAIWYSEGHSSPGLVLLCGFLAGSAVACKYPAILFVVFPLSIGFAWPRRAARWRPLAWFATAVLIGGGLWLGKNVVLTGNPTYPLLYSVFGGESRTDASDAQWKKAHQVPPDAEGRRYSPAQAWSSLIDVLGRSRWQSPLLLPLMTLVFFSPTARRHGLPWLLYAAFFLLCWWLLTHRIERFWVPLLPVMALLAGVGACWSSRRVWRRLIWSVLGLLLIANLVLFCTPLVGRNEYFVSLNQLRDDPAFSHVSAAHRYLNQHVEAGSKVLLVGDAAVFDLQVPALYSTCFDECRFEEMIRGKNARQRREALRDAGISHVYVNWAEIRRYRATYGFSDFVTRELVHGQLVKDQQLLRPVSVPNLDPANGEVFAVRGLGEPPPAM